MDSAAAGSAVDSAAAGAAVDSVVDSVEAAVVAEAAVAVVAAVVVAAAAVVASRADSPRRVPLMALETRYQDPGSPRRRKFGTSSQTAAHLSCAFPQTTIGTPPGSSRRWHHRIAAVCERRSAAVSSEDKVAEVPAVGVTMQCASHCAMALLRRPRRSVQWQRRGTGSRDLKAVAEVAEVAAVVEVAEGHEGVERPKRMEKEVACTTSGMTGAVLP